MNKADFIPLVDALKDVVDIRISGSQDVVTFGRVGHEIWKRTVPAMMVIAAAITYGCIHMTVESVIMAVLLTAVLCAYLVGVFRKVSVNIPNKSLETSLFNIMFSTLNGREPSPKEFCVKFHHNGHRKEITIANLTDGNGPATNEHLAHILKIWHLLEDILDTNDFDTEFQMSGRNAIFA